MPQRNRKSEQIRRANRVIQSRSFILMLVMGVLLFVVLFFKIYQLQIGRHDELQKKAINQQVRSTVVTASRFVGELEVCNASLTFTFSGSTLTTVTGTFLPPIDTSESGETALDAVTALVRFLDYRNASGAVCTGITWLSAGYLVQSTTSAPLQLVPVLRVDTDVYSYYVNIVSGEVSRVSA